MKARVRATGEIVDVKFSTHPNPAVDETYWWCKDKQESYHKSELDFMECDIDWEQRRYEIAKEAMIGILSNEDEVNYACSDAEYSKNEVRTVPKSISRFAVACADALIGELKKKR